MGMLRSFLHFWSHLLKKSLMEDFIFCAVSFEMMESVGVSSTTFGGDNDMLSLRPPVFCLSQLHHKGEMCDDL